MRGLQEDMQELKADRKTLIRNINMLACTSSIGRMDRPILFMYANRFKGIETGF